MNLWPGLNAIWHTAFGLGSITLELIPYKKMKRKLSCILLLYGQQQQQKNRDFENVEVFSKISSTQECFGLHKLSQ